MPAVAIQINKSTSAVVVHLPIKYLETINRLLSNLAVLKLSE
jgi:hypothetical protein